VIHSGAIKSDVTQTSTEERYVGIHVHLSLPLSFFCPLSLPPFCFSLSFSFLLREALRGCIRAETARKKRSDPTSSRVFDARQIAAYFEPELSRHDFDKPAIDEIFNFCRERFS